MLDKEFKGSRKTKADIKYFYGNMGDSDNDI
jgi:hypothetical protein